MTFKEYRAVLFGIMAANTASETGKTLEHERGILMCRDLRQALCCVHTVWLETTLASDERPPLPLTYFSTLDCYRMLQKPT